MRAIYCLGFTALQKTKISSFSPLTIGDTPMVPVFYSISCRLSWARFESCKGSVWRHWLLRGPSQFSPLRKWKISDEEGTKKRVDQRQTLVIGHHHTSPRQYVNSARWWWWSNVLVRLKWSDLAVKITAVSTASTRNGQIRVESHRRFCTFIFIYLNWPHRTAPLCRVIINCQHRMHIWSNSVFFWINHDDDHYFIVLHEIGSIVSPFKWPTGSLLSRESILNGAQKVMSTAPVRVISSKWSFVVVTRVGGDSDVGRMFCGKLTCCC